MLRPALDRCFISLLNSQFPLIIKGFLMFCVIKRLSVLAFSVCMVPLTAEAHSHVPRVVAQSAALKPASDSWVTNFGFLPINNKSSACRVVQKGFWPRPQGCVR
jgi:hypothetical protein